MQHDMSAQDIDIHRDGDDDNAAAAAATLRIRVNGEPTAAPAGSSVADVMQRLGLPADGVATALNGVFVARAERGTQRLRDGDRIDCLQPIVGG